MIPPKNFSPTARVWILYFILVSASNVKGESYGECITNLVKYIEEDSRKYQVMIVLNTEDSTSIVDEIIRKIVTNAPSSVINLANLKKKNYLDYIQLPRLDEPRATTLFILIDSSENNMETWEENPFMKFLNDLAPARIRPSTLIIAINKEPNNNYQKLLGSMWSNRFLDVTILQLSMQKIPKYSLQSVNEVKTRLHFFNPFKKIFVETSCTSKTQWFPDKLRNMNGHSLKGAMIELPAYSYVHFNHSGNSVEFSGADLKTFNTLSKVMNFSASMVSSPDARIGVFNAANKSATGILGKCIRNEINAFVTLLSINRPRKTVSYEYTRGIDQETFHAIVPIIPKEDKIVHKSTLYLAVLLFVIVFMLIWLVSLLFKFDVNIWHPINILQVLLGISLAEFPISASQRIFFVIVIIIGFWYSSDFFSGLTFNNLEVKSEMEFKNLEDLDKSDLIPVVHPNLFPLFFQDAEGTLLNISKKCIRDEIMDDMCPRYIGTYGYKNLSCLFQGSGIIKAIESTKDDFGYATIKIMPYQFFKSNTIMVLEKASPYVERFNQLLLRISESGLRRKWTGDYSGDPLFSYRNAEKKSVYEVENFGAVKNLTRRLEFVLLHGYLLSILIFLIEILCYRIKIVVTNLSYMIVSEIFNNIQHIP